MQRLYISTLLETLDNLVDFWSDAGVGGSGGGGVAATQTQAGVTGDASAAGDSCHAQDKIKAIIFPTRRTEEIGRLNSATVINIEGLVTRVRAIQVSHYESS